MSLTRTPGTFNFGANFEGGLQGPMDARQLCPTFDDRAALIYTYLGMICVVTRDQERAGGSAANNGLYIRINDPVETGRAPDDPNVPEDWELLGGGAGNPVVAFKYFTTQDEITTAVTNDEPEAEVTTNTIDLSGEDVAVTTGQIVIESGTNYTDFTSDFDGNYIVSDTGTLLLCSVDDYDAGSFTTTITFDGEADPATDFDNIPVTSTTLELNDLVIILQNDTFYKVNIQSGAGGSGRYNPDKAGEPWAVTPSTEVPNTIGGITQGTEAQELDDMPFSQLWNKLLFPAQLPAIGARTAALNAGPSGYYYVGEAISGTFEPTVTSLGSITVSPQGPAGPQGPASYGLNSATFSGPGYSGPADIYDPTKKADVGTPHALCPVSLNATLGTMTWTFAFDFEEGPMPKDSQGNDVPARKLSTPNAADTKTRTVYGTYPVFVGTGTQNGFEDASVATQNYQNGPVRPNKQAFYEGTLFHFSQTYGEPNENVKHRVAVPTTWGKPTIYEIQSDNVNYGDVSSSFISGGTRTDLFGGIEYTIWKKNTGTTLAVGDPLMPNGTKKPKFKIEY